MWTLKLLILRVVSTIPMNVCVSVFFLFIIFFTPFTTYNYSFIATFSVFFHSVSQPFWCWKYVRNRFGCWKKYNSIPETGIDYYCYNVYCDLCANDYSYGNRQQWKGSHFHSFFTLPMTNTVKHPDLLFFRYCLSAHKKPKIFKHEMIIKIRCTERRSG